MRDVSWVSAAFGWFALFASVAFLYGCDEPRTAGSDAAVAADANKPASADANSAAQAGTEADTQPPATNHVDDTHTQDGPDAATPPRDASTPQVVDAAAANAVDAGPSDAGHDTGPEDAAVPLAGAGGASGGGAGHAGSAAAPSCGPPGLYVDPDCTVLAEGVQRYEPRFPLWSDNASKERFVYLPPGTRIDTSNADRWTFPVGTRLYKTFATDTLKIETRLLEKTRASANYNSWKAITYAWAADQRHVAPAENGVKNALGTQLDIPSSMQCLSCHSMNATDAAIGFNALQLNHDGGGVTLAELLDRQLLVNGSAGAAPNITLENSLVPGDATTQAALGYMHGNCGHCHGGPNPRANQRLWLTVGMTQLTDAPIFQTAVCQCLVSWTGRKNADGAAYELRVSPSHSVLSGIIGRMSSRDVTEQMPPVGTKLQDAAGLSAVRTWIDSLDESSCDAMAAMCRKPGTGGAGGGAAGSAGAP